LERNAEQDECWFVVVCPRNEEHRVLPKQQGVTLA
jgi:hypothetical protein